MRKTLAPGDRAGMSATLEYRRACRAARRRGSVSALLAAAAVTTVVAAGWRNQAWLVAIGGAAAIGAWVMRPDPDADRWRRGAAGESATARLLATLPRRYIVLHDRRVPGHRSNIDHIVIGPPGVVVVDSKAYRASVSVRRGQVWAGDHEVATTPVAWQAEQVAQLLGVGVTPIVAVHGRGLRRRGKVANGVRVVPAPRLCSRLRRGRRRLTRSEVTRLARQAERRLPPAAGG